MFDLVLDLRYGGDIKCDVNLVSSDYNQNTGTIDHFANNFLCCMFILWHVRLGIIICYAFLVCLAMLLLKYYGNVSG